MSYYTSRIVNFLFIVLLLAGVNTAYASDLAVNSPSVSEVTAPTADVPDTNPAYQYPFAEGPLAADLRAKVSVIELFSSIDCPFCVTAEQLVADLNQYSAASVLICDTDTEEENIPLARTFCIARQERYGAKLSDGLVYTPQMIINGHIDAVGREFEDVRVGLTTALADDIIKLTPREGDEKNIILVDLPVTKQKGKGRTDVFAITYRPPYPVPDTVRNVRPAPLVRVANRFIPLGGWDGARKTISIPFVLDADNAGLVVMVQDEDNNIIAVGEWPERLPSP